MIKKLMVFILCIIMIQSINASLTATITTPQVTFKNYTGQQVGYYLGIRNDNDFIVNISITQPEDFDISFNELDFSLEPGELRKVNYTINLNKVGTSTKVIPVLFYTNESSFGLSAKIIMIVKANNNTVNNTVVDNTNNQEEVVTSSGGGSTSTNNLIVNQTNVSSSNTEIKNETETVIQEESNQTTVVNSIPEPNNNRIYLYIVLVIIILIILFVIYKYFKKKKPTEVTEVNTTEVNISDGKNNI